MITLFDKFPNSKGANEFGSNYLILKDSGSSIDHKILIKCKTCLAETHTSPSKIFIGQKPCKCGRNYYKSPERKAERVKEVAEIKGIFPIEDNLKLNSSGDKFTVECRTCLHRWDVSFSYFCGKIARGCPCCAGQKRYTDQEYIERINIIGKQNKFRFHSQTTDKIRASSWVRLKCEVCDNVWKSHMANVLSGKYSCPNCARLGFNPLRSSHLYVLKVVKQGEEIGFKFGISNVKSKRLSNLHINNKGLTFIPILDWFYEDGLICRDHESIIRSKFGKAIERIDMPDGYTETCSVGEISSLYNEIESLYVKHKKSYHGGVVSGGDRTDPFGS
jgi:hypothetical protein